MICVVVVWFRRGVYDFESGLRMRGLKTGIFFFQAEDGIRDLVRSRGLGDVYKRQPPEGAP